MRRIHFFAFLKCVWILVHFHDPLSFWCFSFGYRFKAMITSPWLRSWQSAKQFYVNKIRFCSCSNKRKRLFNILFKHLSKIWTIVNKKHKL
jgi:hypothetical protein